jgi:predicted site-specific integrase-resolvase
MSRLLTTEEVAQRLGIDAATLVQWRWNRRGPAFIRQGGAIRYPEAAVARWQRDERR